MTSHHLAIFAFPLAAQIASVMLAYLIWPRLKSLEVRGRISRHVPGFLGGDRNNSAAVWLLWTTRVPDDRPRLRRLILAFRLLQVLTVVSFIFAMLSLPTTGVDEPSARDRIDAPPPVTLRIPDTEQSAQTTHKGMPEHVAGR